MVRKIQAATIAGNDDSPASHIAETERNAIGEGLALRRRFRDNEFGPSLAKATARPLRCSFLTPLPSWFATGPGIASTCSEEARDLCTPSRNLLLAEFELVFEVSRDEEYVRLRLAHGGARFDLGARVHNYVLLTLARKRLRDMNAEHPASLCGWTYQDDFAAELQLSAPQLSVQIFRARGQFVRLGIEDGGTIVERRGSSGQLRIGTSNFTVVGE